MNTSVKPLSLVSGGIALVVALSLPVVTNAAPARLNFVFIMSDDHAAHAVSAYGSKVNRTPQIDRLAQEGMRFKNCFAVNSICTPSRATILTGKYSHINGVPVFNRFDGSQPTFAKMLQKAGYQTAMIGKWHLFSDPTGFDYWNILPGQGLYHNPEFIEMGTRKKLSGYVTDIITDQSLQFLKRRDPSKPFLLMCHHKAPHREWSPDEKHAAMYNDTEIPEPVTFHDDYRGRSRAAAEATMRIERDFRKSDLKSDPPGGLSPAELKKWNYQRYMKDYLRCVAAVDDSVGQLLDYLDTAGLRENTVVIYTSDQGFFLGDHGWYDKRFMYEESLRMPFLVRLPGMIKKGSVNEDMVLNVDFAPTFLELAGLPVPGDIQGRSIAPLLRGQTPPDWRTSMYYRYYHYPQDHRVQPHYGVRTDRHKLIYFNKLDEWELFDLERDPHETNNVYGTASYAAQERKLKAELARLKAEFKDEDQFQDGVFDPKLLAQVPLELALQYDFSEVKDGMISDRSPNKHHGKSINGTVTAGRSGRALQLNGDGHVAVREAPGSLDPAAKPFVVGGWCRPETANGVIISHGGGAQGYALFLQDGIPCFAVRSEGALTLVKGTEKIQLHQWIHLAGELTAKPEATLWIGGKQVASSKASPIAIKPRDGFAVGADPGGRVGEYKTEQSWNGLLEDVRVYWGQLTADVRASWARQ